MPAVTSRHTLQKEAPEKNWAFEFRKIKKKLNFLCEQLQQDRAENSSKRVKPKKKRVKLPTIYTPEAHSLDQSLERGFPETDEISRATSALKTVVKNLKAESQKVKMAALTLT